MNRYSPDSARGTLILRRYGPNGRFITDQHLRLRRHEWSSGVATAPDEALYVTANDFEDSGDLWRLPA